MPINAGNAPDANALRTSVVFTAGANQTVLAGNAITFTAQVRDINNATVSAGGSVTFYVGAQSLGTVTQSGGNFTYAWTIPINQSTGAQTVTAQFSGIGAPAAVQYAGSSGTTGVLAYFDVRP